MGCRGKKRKRGIEKKEFAGRPSKRPVAAPVIVAPEGDSSCGSSDSLLSDACSGKTEEEKIASAALALTKVVATSPEGVVSFVRRITAETVVRSLDCDLISTDNRAEMSEGRMRWTDNDLRLFLEICLEEIEDMNIISNTPSTQGWKNLARKFEESTSVKLKQKQLLYQWRTAKRSFEQWEWLETHATGLGRDPVTQAIIAEPAWWDRMEETKSGISAFACSPLKHIELHH